MQSLVVSDRGINFKRDHDHAVSPREKQIGIVRNAAASIMGGFIVRFAIAAELPEVRDGFAKQGAKPSPMSSGELGLYIKADSDKWASVLKDAKVRQ